jgi:hypothetical protein
MPVSPAKLRRAALVVLAAALGACTAWSRQPVGAPGEEPFYAGPVRVTRSDGSTVLLDNVTLGRDSVVGRRSAAARARVAIPLSEVRSVEAQRENVLGTLAVVVVGTVAGFALWMTVVLSTIGTGN